MDNRIQIDQTEPEAYKGMFVLEHYLQNSKLSATQLHLMKIKASQLNACAYCINMHTKEALKDGESKERIFLLSAWREANVFSPEEKIILQMTEEVTLIHQNGLSDACYNNAINTFGDKHVAQIIMAIATINSWNRIAVSTRKPIES